MFTDIKARSNVLLGKFSDDDALDFNTRFALTKTIGDNDETKLNDLNFQIIYEHNLSPHYHWNEVNPLYTFNFDELWQPQIYTNINKKEFNLINNIVDNDNNTNDINYNNHDDNYSSNNNITATYLHNTTTFLNSTSSSYNNLFDFDAINTDIRNDTNVFNSFDNINILNNINTDSFNTERNCSIQNNIL